MANVPQILYFHGLPGGADELNLFGADVARAAEGFHVVDRKRGHGADPSYIAYAARIKAQFGETPLKLVGFSLGASAALRTAALLSNQVVAIDLISAAAPLSLGDYLSDMAGAPVFRLAQSRPRLFGALARLQSVTATMAPNLLYQRLFATANGDDKSLAADPHFKARLINLLRTSLGPDLAVYRVEILDYVTDWRPSLAAITQPVTLHHGSADNWTPIAMAHDLARHLPNVIGIHLHEGSSHYSTLGAYFRRL